MKAYNSDSLQSTHPVHVYVTDTQEAISNLDNITYWKGASLLKNLAFIIGEEKFKEGLQRYFKKFAWSNVCLTDFVDSMEDPSLNKWIEEWVDSKGLNSIELILTFADDSCSTITSAIIHQHIVSGEILRSHLILIEGINEQGSLFKIKVKVPAEETSELPQLLGKENIKGIIVNSEDHGYVQVILDEQSTEFLFKQGNIKELSALNRGLAWQSLWNRVESLKTASSDFIEIISNLLIYEDEEEILDLIISYSITILGEYCPLEYVPKYSHILFNAIMAKLEVSPSNKCLQRKVFLLAYTNEDIEKSFEYSSQLNRSEK